MEELILVPTEQETKEAIAALPKMKVISKGSTSVVAFTNTVKIPARIIQVMKIVMQGMADGKTLTLSQAHTSVKAETDYVTTQEAAAILGVSRQHVVKLFETGELSGWIVGDRHRRMLRRQVEAYKAMKAKQFEGMMEMTKLSQEMEKIADEKQKGKRNK
jgi:excisionase family DNA binding protein